MKIRTQFIITTAIFVVALASIVALLIFTDQEVNRLEAQQLVASNLERNARGLSYISNEYLLYGESQQRERWEAQFADFSENLSMFNPRSPEQQQLAVNLEHDQEQLAAVFSDVVSTLENPSTSPVNSEILDFIRVSWSRMEVQTQGLVFDSMRLTQSLHNQTDQVKKTNTILVFVLLGIISAYFVVNYLTIERRTLKSISELRAGSEKIGAGNLDYAIKVKSNDEIGELSRAFNRMTADLKKVTASRVELEKEINERKKTEESLKNSREKYRNLFNSMGEGFALSEIVFDSAGKPCDHRWLEVNKAWEKIVGVPAEKIVGKTSKQVFQTVESEWIDIYGKVAITGEPAHFEQYSRSFNKWLEVNAYSPGKGYFARTLTDITERKKAEEALKQYASKLEVSNKELESFSYTVSHDLRAPLKSMDGYSKALLEDYASELDEQGKKWLREIRSSSQLMAELIDDILSLSRVVRAELQIKKVNLSEIVHIICERLKRTEPKRSVEFCIMEDIEATGDGNLLLLALENLLGNAFKFTSLSQNARIEFGENRVDGLKTYYVRDNGAGFDMTYVGNLFKPFHRLHSNTEFPGTGIGLATVQRIIQRHGGKLWAEGEIGKGAVFFFTLYNEGK